MVRQQLPVSSPVTLSSLLGGLAGALGRDRTRALADVLRTHFAARAVRLTDSGTSALTLAIAACTARRKAPIALPAYNCYDLATAAEGADASVVFYDIDPTTLAPDLSSFRRALEQEPSAVVVAHLFGLPVDVMRLRAEVALARAILIEDAAQGAGATVRGVPAGALGSLAVLSFGRGKGISGGGGGALLANDEAGADLLESMRSRVTHGRAGWGELASVAAQMALARPQLYGALTKLPFLHLGETVYQPPPRLRSIARSTAGVVQRIWNDSFEPLRIRSTHAARLREQAHLAGWQTIEPAPDAIAGWLRLPLLPAWNAREEILNRDARRLGIMPGYPRPLSRLAGFQQRCLNASDDFDGAEHLAAQLITLPTHRLLDKHDLVGLEEWLRRWEPSAREDAAHLAQTAAHNRHGSPPEH